ncbi:MAG: hypothetical protein ABWZ74_08220 [Hyphomicrobiaceae bacterium]|jgi:hypothetical protein
MQQIFNQLLQFVQQGVSAIFKFIQLIWAWSVGQITTLMSVPWQDWPLWKQVLLVLIAGGVIYALYSVAMQLFEASTRILTAFATLLIALVNTLPSVIVAGAIALGGVWVLNNLDGSTVRLPASLSWLQTGG